MKLLLTIATFLLLLSNNENQTLPDFEVTFISGCAGITESKIKVFKQHGKYYAKHIKPTYYNGREIDGTWLIELNKNQISACSKFLTKAKSLPNKCERWSSSEFFHIVKLESETIEINGNCEWENLDFNYLDTELFSTKHEELKGKKESFLNELTQSIKGKWYLKPIEKEILRDDILIFSKDFKSAEFVEFKDQNLLKSNCSKSLNIIKPQTYKIDISDGWNEVVFTLNWGEITLKKDYNTWYENDATFTLVEKGDKELKLKYLW